MKLLISTLVIGAAALAFAAPAEAKGCIKGAVVGGVAGHMAGHHGAAGAMAGCAIGHHHASKNAKAEQSQDSQQPR